MVDIRDDKRGPETNPYNCNPVEILPPQPISEEILAEVTKDEDVTLVTVHYRRSDRFPTGAQLTLFRSSAPVQNCTTIGGGVTMMQALASSGFAVTPTGTGWRCIKIVKIGGINHVICIDVLA